MSEQDAFGWWLSGLVDGEGCFWIGRHSYGKRRWVSAMVCFQIKLRSDDRDGLLAIQKFLGCGRLIVYHSRDPKTPNRKPTCAFKVNDLRDLEHIVIPHFEKYPLRMKKARDFAIWRQAVSLAFRVKQRGCRGRLAGSSRWTEREKQELGRLIQALRDVRRFDAVANCVPAMPAKREEKFLWD